MEKQTIGKECEHMYTHISYAALSHPVSSIHTALSATPNREMKSEHKKRTTEPLKWRYDIFTLLFLVVDNIQSFCMSIHLLLFHFLSIVVATITSRSISFA